MIDQIIAPNTTTAMATHTQKISMCRSYILRLISVTPRGTLSWLQPESAWAAGKPDAAAAARASGASFAQVIVTCLTAHTPTVAGGASQKKKADQLRLKTLGPTARRATR